MSASFRSVSMWVRAMKSLYGLNTRFVLSLRTNIQATQRYYSATSPATNDQTPSATEKLQTIEKEQNEEIKKEDKGEISAKEKELLEENEKLIENVKNLDGYTAVLQKLYNSLVQHIKPEVSQTSLSDKYKRALADNENIRKRMRREVADAKQFGIQNFVKDLVEVADVLEKATESVPKEALEEGNIHLKSLYEGLQMTEAQLQSVLKRHGVLKINPIGEKFNPNHHEALFEQVDPSKEPGTVGTVTKIGYRLHERVVRPAMVGVIKTSNS